MTETEAKQRTSPMQSHLWIAKSVLIFQFLRAFRAGLHANSLYLPALDVLAMVRIAISCLGLAAICD